MRAAVASLPAAVAALLSSTACFDGGVPAGATLFCVSDADCPSTLACDVAGHLCVPPGDNARGPTATRAVFEPAEVAAGPVSLVIEADEAIAAVPAIALAPPLVDPGFVLAGDGGEPRAVLTVDAGGLDEGFYPLVSVTLADAEGHEAATAIEALLRVDRTAPQVQIVDIEAGTDGVLADREGFDALRAELLVSEPLLAADVDVTLGSVRLSCVDAEAVLAFTCTGTLPLGGAGTVDGGNALLVTVHDAAGNEATAQPSVLVDLDAPDVVAGSVSLEVDGDPLAAFATLGSELELRFLVDEPLGAPPVVVLDGGEALTFAVSPATSGNLWVLELPVAVVAAGAPELRSMQAQLVDRFGHARTLALPLPEPFAGGLRVVAVPGSPCTIPPRDDGSTCTDFDADGFFGASAACAPAVLDCDDRDPAIHPGAIEIPDDGARNDCTDAADAPLAGVFVDDVNGDDAAAGTAAAPVRTLGEAQSRANGPGDVIVLAAGQTFDWEDDRVVASILGGRDPVTWQRVAGAHSKITKPGECFPVFEMAGALLEGVHVTMQVEMENGGVARDVATDCTFRPLERAMVIDADLAELEIVAGASGTRILGRAAMSRVGRNELGGVDLVFHRVAFTETLALLNAGQAVIANSIIRGTFGQPIVLCDSCDALEIYHSNLIGDGATKGVDFTVVAGASLTLVGNLIRLLDPEELLDVSAPGPVLFKQNVVDMSGSGPLLFIAATGTQRDIAGETGFEALGACDWPGCVAADGNRIAELTFLGDDLTLDDSVQISLARRVGDATAVGAPTFVAGDAIGRCRANALSAAGALEQ